MNKFIIYIKGQCLETHEPVRGGIPKDWQPPEILRLQDKSLEDNKFFDTKDEAHEFMASIRGLRWAFDAVDYEVLRMKIKDDGSIVFNPEPSGYYYAPYIPKDFGKRTWQ